ncbi:MAG TPA: hypothetical protein VJI46_04815 [Candidatus Nanoarchaeia archaeon]|nr:hypothetical protein [Candidatus Nanoarchaeia archaeon]
MAEDEDRETGKEEVYEDEGREEMVADDELSPEEAGFMKGYEDAEEEGGKESKESKEEEE